MKFEVEQRFQGPRDAVQAVYIDPMFYARLQGLPKISQPKVIDKVVDGERVVMRVRYRFTADLPPGASSVIDRDKLTWVEETTYDLASYTAASRLLPDHYADRFSATAAVSFIQDPDDASRSRRLIRGDVKVRMPLVGGKVERAIVSGFQEHLADEEQIVNDLLRT